MHPGSRSDAQFNWRFNFEIGLPTRRTKLTLQLWDTACLGANDALAECSLQLGTLYENVQRTKELQEVT
mgnify:CR=1 FL=1